MTVTDPNSEHTSGTARAEPVHASTPDAERPSSTGSQAPDNSGADAIPSPGDQAAPSTACPREGGESRHRVAELNRASVRARARRLAYSLTLAIPLSLSAVADGRASMAGAGSASVPVSSVTVPIAPSGAASHLEPPPISGRSSSQTLDSNSKQPLNVAFERFGLSDADVDLYRRIFAYQEDGAWDQADRLIQRLDDRLLMGHVDFQRLMHPTDYRSSFEELRDWLAEYADHPGAERIHRLANRRQPEGTEAPAAPATGSGVNGVDAMADLYGNGPARPSDRPGWASEAVRALEGEVSRLAGQGSPTAALERLENDDATEHLGAGELSRLHGEIAAGYYFAGVHDKALTQAMAAHDSAQPDPNGLWFGGLAAWRKDDHSAALELFEAVARSDRASAWQRSAGAYWAARANLRLRNPGAVSAWLEEAATYPLTFYGLLASETLGLAPDLTWHPPRLGEAELKAIESEPAARRALALIQVGEAARAEDELEQLSPDSGSTLADAVVGLATLGGLPALAYRLGNALTDRRGERYYSALFPEAPWRSETTHGIDDALVNAVIREESRFNPEAQSGAGAAGLMQIMPSTANGLAADVSISSQNIEPLLEPERNIALGRMYIRDLLERRDIDGNLIETFAAYNAGPSNVSEWRQTLDAEYDPLLFMESIPIRETRRFTRLVLTNYWLYLNRSGQDSDTLNAVATGNWPRYIPGEVPEVQVADHGED